jgi:hypothetical protein
MKELSAIEIRVKTLVEDFFANRISGEELDRELTREREELELIKKKRLKTGRKRPSKGTASDCTEYIRPFLN